MSHAPRGPVNEPGIAGWARGAFAAHGLAILTLLVTACAAEPPGPRLEAVTPAAAAVGAMVTITGERLCGAAGDCETAGGAIRIGYDTPVQAMILSYADTTATLRIPQIAPVGPTVLIATVNEHASNALAFEVLATP